MTDMSFNQTIPVRCLSPSASRLRLLNRCSKSSFKVTAGWPSRRTRASLPLISSTKARYMPGVTRPSDFCSNTVSGSEKSKRSCALVAIGAGRTQHIQPIAQRRRFCGLMVPGMGKGLGMLQGKGRALHLRGGVSFRPSTARGAAAADWSAPLTRHRFQG